MMVISYIVLGFLILRIFIAITNIITRQWLTLKNITKEPFISILIPARNEEKNIGNLINNILNQDYQNYELIIYDDISDDTTPEIINKYAEKSDKIRYVAGTELPGGWLGKNFACHQLSLKAKGSYFLFLDADVTVESGLIRNSLWYLLNKDITLFSVFPQQVMNSAGEKLTVPLMNWILVSLLPLVFVEHSSYTSLSAANGQFMFFKADIYKKNLWHERAKGHKVEDIEIVKLIKREGFKAKTLLSNGQIKCRMYNNYKDSIEGFSKNVIAFFGNSIILTSLFSLITTFGIFIIFFTSNYLLVLIYVFLSILLRMLVSIISRQSVLYNILLIIPQQITFIFVVLKAFYNKSVKYGNWKNRTIKF